MGLSPPTLVGFARPARLAGVCQNPKVPPWRPAIRLIARPPLLSRGGREQGTSGNDTRLVSPPARPASSLRNSRAISRRRAVAYALDQRFACSLRPIFCACAPFQRRGRLPPVPPRTQERAARTRRGIRPRARPASLRCVSPARDRLSYAPSLTATRPSLCGRRIPIFES